MTPKPILDYLDSTRSKHLDQLIELLRIPSIANNPDGACRRAARRAGQTVIRAALHTSAAVPDDRMRRRRRRPHVPDNGRALG